MCKTFGSVGVRFDQVIRTWFYLGGIVDNDGPLQRYKELNRARTDFFRNIHFLDGRAPVRPESTAGLSGKHRHRHHRPRNRAQRHRLGF